MPKYKEIPIQDLRPGMVVVDTGLSWVDMPFLYSKAGPVTEKDLLGLKGSGYRTVFIELQEAPRGDGKSSALTLSESIEHDLEAEKKALGQSLSLRKKAAAPTPPPSNGEFKRAERIYDDSLQLARDMMHDARLGKVDTRASEPLVNELLDSIMSNKDALLSMKQLRRFDEYTFTHSINVSVLSCIFGKFLGLDQRRLSELATAGLYHDIGKARIPEDVLNKPGKLTDEEFGMMKAHPAKGHALLTGQPVSDDILSAVLDHHEKHSGRGYPRGLAGDAISPLGRIVAVADVYDALTSRRVYKAGMQPSEALRIMYGMRETDFAPLFVEKFIKCLGIYPPGSLVRLSSGHMAVVCGTNEDKPLLPSVKIVADAKGLLPEPKALDLGQTGGKLSITESLNPEEYGLDTASHLV